MDVMLPGKVTAAIERYNMIRPGSPVMAAVSGGADSVALLHVLAGLRESLGIDLSAAHLNHRLRGAASDEDAAFVSRVAGGLGIECVSDSADVRALASEEKRSLEDAAREARRRFLLRAARARGAAVVATGHHADDQAETVLMRLIRGAGVRGLAGIDPVSPEGFVRPLIECRRGEIRRYLHDRGIPYREDASNEDRSFLRNRVRHELIPLIERDFSPAIVPLLCRTSDNMAGVDRMLSGLGEKALAEAAVESAGERMSLDSNALRAYDKVTWRYVFQRAYRELAGNLETLSHAHLLALTDMVERQPTGTSIHLPGGFEARKTYGLIELRRREPQPEPALEEREVLLPGATPVPEMDGVLETELMDIADLPPDLRIVDPTVAFFDVKDVSPPLSVRGRRRGDRIRPFGSPGTKKLKDLLIDLKIPPESRDSLPVLTDALGLLWVAGVKRSDRARIGPETRGVFCARWVPGRRFPDE